MTTEEYQTYFRPATRNGVPPKVLAKYLAGVIVEGEGRWTRVYWSRTPCSEREINLLKTLAGPHWRTVLRVYEAKYGKEVGSDQ